MEDYPPATLFGTHTHKLTSSVVGQDYAIPVLLPPDYDDTPDKAYPVVYILDADFGFGIVAQATYFLMLGGDIPPAIIVGIGWSIRSLDDWNLQRNRDFIPRVVDFLPGSVDGGADAFLSFIETELIPFISANYRADTADQTICGHSSSGLFGLYTLLQRPGLFRGIVASSPSVWIIPDVMAQLETSHYESGKSLSAAVYMSFGSLEGDWGVQPGEAFYHLLADRHYEGLTIKYEKLDGESHGSALSPGLLRGIRAVFSMLAEPPG